MASVPHRVSILVLLVVSVAACGASATPASSSAPAASAGSLGFTADQLCALVSQTAMGAALGSAVGAGVPSGVNAPSCSWQSNGSPMIGATIAATDPPSVGQIPYALQNMPNPHVTAVTGLGDAAFFAAGNGVTAELDIKKGGHAITITVGSANPDYTQAQQEAAELAIGKAAVGGM